MAAASREFSTVQITWSTHRFALNSPATRRGTVITPPTIASACCTRQRARIRTWSAHVQKRKRLRALVQYVSLSLHSTNSTFRIPPVFTAYPSLFHSPDPIALHLIYVSVKSILQQINTDSPSINCTQVPTTL